MHLAALLRPLSPCGSSGFLPGTFTAVSAMRTRVVAIPSLVVLSLELVVVKEEEEVALVLMVRRDRPSGQSQVGDAHRSSVLLNALPCDGTAASAVCREEQRTQ